MPSPLKGDEPTLKGDRNSEEDDRLLAGSLRVNVFVQPCIARVAPGGNVFHVLNRAKGRLRLLKIEDDFFAFKRSLPEVHERYAQSIRQSGKRWLDCDMLAGFNPAQMRLRARFASWVKVNLFTFRMS